MSTSETFNSSNNPWKVFKSKTEGFTNILNSLVKNESHINPFTEIKYEILIIYLIFLVMDTKIAETLSLSSLLLTGIMLVFVLHRSNKNINKYANTIFTAMLFLLSFYCNNMPNIKILIPQIILITTNKISLALIAQTLSFSQAYLLKDTETARINLPCSVICFMMLVLIRRVIISKFLTIDGLRAQTDTLKARVDNLQSEIYNNTQSHRKFILGLSQEFKNPLNNIMGNIDLIQKNLDDVNPVTEQLKMAKLGCETLLNFLNNVLDYSKAQNDELDIHIISANIRKSLEKSWGLLKEVLRQKNLKGELYLHRSTPTLLMYDPCRMHQILINLVQNSVKLTNKGFVRIVISWHPHNSTYTQQDTCKKRRLSRVLQFTANESPVKTSKRAPADLSLPKYSDTDGGNATDEELNEFQNAADGINFPSSNNYFQLDMKTTRFPKGYHQKIYNPDDQPFGYLKIQIVDSGTGLPTGVMPNLFSENNKFKPELNQKIEGGGLSLWITRKLCEKMDGDIKIVNESSQGSTFLVFIKSEISPQSIGTPTPSPYNRNEKRPNLVSMNSAKFLGLTRNSTSQGVVNSQSSISKVEEVQLTAMVVDDIPYNQQLNKQFLEICGVDVKHIAENGLEAYDEISKYSKMPYDLIFIDLDMPVMDGKTSIAKIRDYEKKNGLNPVIVVILTGNCTEKDLMLCLDKKGTIRANYFYRKPMSLVDCQNLIRLIRREKLKKKAPTIPNLSLFSDHILVYEKDPFQQVLLENYLKIGQRKYKILDQDEIEKNFCNNPDAVNAILYNCQGETEDCIRFVKRMRKLIDERNIRKIPIFGILTKTDLRKVDELKRSGFKDFLVKPFDYDCVNRLFSYPCNQKDTSILKL